MVVITQGDESLAFDSINPIDEKVINPIDQKVINPLLKRQIAPLTNQQTLQLESLLHDSVW